MGAVEKGFQPSANRHGAAGGRRETINFQNIVRTAGAIADAAVEELKSRRASEGKTDITW